MDRQRALNALERMGRIVKALQGIAPDSKVVREYRKKLRAAEILYENGDVIITENDVDDAIEMARERVGDEFASLLVAPEYEGGK